MSVSEAPVLLGRICSSWRAISLSTPRIWTRLHIVEPPLAYGPVAESYDKKAAQRLEVTKTWLGRAGQCPLSISLESSAYSPPTTPGPRRGQCLPALVSFASRWQHIDLTTPASMLDEISHIKPIDVPMLQTIAFHLDLQHLFPPFLVKWQFFEMLRSPNISGFSVSGNSFDPEKLPVHWDRLTDLTVDGRAWETLLTSDMVVQTLSRCPELRSCKLAVSDRDPQLLHSVELPFLHTLELDSGSSATVPRLLERLSLPGLRNFILHGYADHEGPFSLAPFFDSWRLESLTIHSNSFSRTSLLDTLKNLPPTLRRLSILDVVHGGGSELASLDDEALVVLAPRCPILETLHISYCAAISDAALLQFITAKMKGEYRATLRRVQVRFQRQMTLDILPSLAPFIEAGLDVSITYFPLQTTPTPFSPWQGLADAPGQPYW
ncbi:hypothetical protein B0H19DRAFT_1096334 [Mycena capillaripes]|nr:hypothetical protein B0H19DRAFT_1096334 [Mycena capillaripes]